MYIIIFSKIKKAYCPKCKTNISGVEDVIKFHGLRMLYGKVICQSWCRKCRIKFKMN